MPRVAVILSGCGVQDGAEIHEAVLTLLALEEAGASYACLAPDRRQIRTVNHRTGRETEEVRNVLVESARIARGKVQDIADASADEFDAVMMPGGFGAALNLCDFGINGEQCTVDPTVEKFLLDMRSANKPIGAVCIAPAVLARVFGKSGVKLTIGKDAGTAKSLEKMGAKHVACAVDHVVVDETHKVVTSPAYMTAKNITEVQASVSKCVHELLRLAKAK